MYERRGSVALNDVTQPISRLGTGRPIATHNARNGAPAVAAEQPHTKEKSPAKSKRRIVFVDLARAVGALLVFYSHLTELWMQDHGASSLPVKAVDVLLKNPLHMPLQGIGQVAVPLFFLVSGFVVTPIAIRQGGARFALNRTLRVYPALIFTVLLTATVLLLGLDPLSTGQLRAVTPFTVLMNCTLVNYVMVPQDVLVGVAWTLVVEVIFYLLLIILLPILRRLVWLAILIELTFVQVVLMTAKTFGANYFLFAVSVSFVPIVLIGQIIWATNQRHIPPWAGGLFGFAAWGLYVWADYRHMGRLDNSYPLALAFAILLFLLGLALEPKLKQRRIVTALSERSYSIYLLHGLVAFPILDFVYPHVPVEIAIVIALAVTAGMVEVTYRLIENPFHRLSTMLTRRKTRAGQEPHGGANPAHRVVTPEQASKVTAQIRPVGAGRVGFPANNQAAPQQPAPQQPHRSQHSSPQSLPSRSGAQPNGGRHLVADGGPAVSNVPPHRPPSPQHRPPGHPAVWTLPES